MPTSLDDKLASVDGQTQDQANPKRSATAAKDTTNGFAKEAKNPLATSAIETKPRITFAAQDKLPKLPIPELESSCKKFLAALEPLQSAREHSDSQSAVREFLHSDGPELQEKLKRYAEGKTSYIEQFCMSSFLSTACVQANLPKGTIRTLTLTILSYSTSTRSSYLKTIRRQPETTKSLVQLLWSSHHSPSFVPFVRRNCHQTL